MDCARFNQLLDDMTYGEAKELPLDEMKSHADGCSACKQGFIRRMISAKFRRVLGDIAPKKHIAFGGCSLGTLEDLMSLVDDGIIDITGKFWSHANKTMFDVKIKLTDYGYLATKEGS